MKRRRKEIICLGLILGLLFSALSMDCVSAEDGEGTPKEAVQQTAKGFEKPSDSYYSMKVAENADFELMANENGTVAVLDKRNGQLYESNPREEDPIAAGINKTNLQSQFYFTYTDTAGNVTTKNSQTECVNKGWLTYSQIENGIRFTYDLQGAGLEIPIEYRLEEDGLTASIVVKDLVEGKEDLAFYLTDISLLPFLGSAGTQEDGYLVVPDGSGALIYFNNDKSVYGAYSQQIYGRDSALITEKLSADSEVARLPVFGLKKKDFGFLAVITQGDTNATVNAMTSGTLNSQNNAYVSFRYRPFTKTTFLQGNLYATGGNGGSSAVNLTLSPVIPRVEAFSVKYLFLDKKDLSYVDMAEAYRNYLAETCGLTDSVETGSSPFYLNFLGGLRVEKYVLGIKSSVLEPLTTYKQAETILEHLKDLGIDELVVKYTGWQKDGMESRIPSKVQYESRLGGKKGFAELMDYAKDNGIRLFLDFDFVNLYRSGNGISSYSDAAQTVGSTPAYQYTYDYNLLTKKDQGRWKILAPAKMTEAVTSLLDQKDDFCGAQLALSTLGNSIYSDFTHKTDGIDRSDVKKIWEELFRLGDEGFDCVMVDNGNAYTFPYVSHIYNVPLNASGYDIEDEEIPFYQIVLHGLISYSTEPLNLNAMPEKLVLKAVETGSSLSACLMYADNETLVDTKYNQIFSGNYETWLDTLSRDYARTKDFLRQVSQARITGHEKLMEDVYRSTFSNGTVVIVNYRNKAVEVDGIQIPAMDFVSEEGGMQ